jgi:hypothetical protein
MTPRILLTGSTPYTEREPIWHMLVSYMDHATEPITIVRDATGSVEMIAANYIKDHAWFIDEPHDDGNQAMVDSGADSLVAFMVEGAANAKAFDLISRARVADVDWVEFWPPKPH